MIQGSLYFFPAVSFALFPVAGIFRFIVFRRRAWVNVMGRMCGADGARQKFRDGDAGGFGNFMSTALQISKAVQNAFRGHALRGERPAVRVRQSFPDQIDCQAPFTA